MEGRQGGSEPGRDERGRIADERDDRADARDHRADIRERHLDARERVLDRWQESLVGRAAELSLLDDDELSTARTEEERRADAARRRDDAERRRDEAIERDIARDRRARREERAGQAPAEQPAAIQFARMADELHAARGLEDVLQRILEASLDVVPGCDAATIMLTTDGTLSTVASTHDWAGAVDRLQVERSSGPSLDAFVHGAIVTDDLTDDHRWVELADLPDDLPARAAFSVRLSVGGDATGVITFYSQQVDDFAVTALRSGDVLAAHAAVALDRTLERLTFDARMEAWHQALASRDVIGQAKGILMQQLDVRADEAFTRLRQLSQQLNRKVRDIAEFVVVHRRLPDR